MMSNFEELMDDILVFIDKNRSDELMKKIKETAESQRSYKSKHTYDLERFGLSEDKIKKDCQVIYDTFLNGD